jgi:7-cyano-7-deazaguanine synthase in queuosine biosynthesis
MNATTHPNGIAPTRSVGSNKGGTFEIGAKGGRHALAWQYIWDRLDRTEWRYARELAEQAAAEYDLKVVSIIEMLSRMRAAGALEQKMLPIPTTYVQRTRTFTANRNRVHYRIAADVAGA